VGALAPSAHASSVGGVDVRPSVLAAGAPSDYDVLFAGSAPLQQGSSITVDFSGAPGTQIGNASARVDGAGAAVTVQGAVLTVTVAQPTSSATIDLSLSGIVNPPSDGPQTLTVATSQDTDPAPGRYAIGFGTLKADQRLVAPGQAVHLTFTFAALNGFAGALALAASSGSTPTPPTLPAKVDAGQTITFTTDWIAPAAPGTTTFTLSVAPRGASSARVAIARPIAVGSVDVSVSAADLKLDPARGEPGSRFRVEPIGAPDACRLVAVTFGGAPLGDVASSGGVVTVPPGSSPGDEPVTIACASDNFFLARRTFTVVASQTTSTSTPTTTAPKPPPPPPGPLTLTVAPQSGRPGAVFEARATGVPSSCVHRWWIYLGRLRIGAPTVVAGSFVDSQLVVPRRAKAGRTKVTLHCGAGAAIARRPFTIRLEPPPPPPSSPLLVLEPSAGPRGSVFAATASRLPGGCTRADLAFGGRRIGSARVRHAALRDGGLTVPVVSRPGVRRVTVQCAGRAVAAAAYDVTSRRDHRVAFVVDRPGSSGLHDRGVLAGAALVAFAMLLLVCLIGFPADWFNDTYVENRERLRAAAYRMLGRAAPAQSRPSRLALTVFFVVAGVLTCAATDWPRLDRAYLWALAGTTLGIVVLTVGFQLPTMVSARATHARGRLQVLAGSVLVAAVCVAATRAFHLDPPYLYGLIAIFVADQAAGDDGSARAAALGALATLVFSVGAWLLELHVEHTAAGAAPSPGVLVLEATLVTVFLAGLGSVVFALVPLPFLPGRAIMRWNVGAWLVLFAAGAYAFALIMLTPRNGYVASVEWSHVGAALVAFGAFALVSVAFMGWFRFVRPPRETPTAATTT
jgi:hypothetical protein